MRSTFKLQMKNHSESKRSWGASPSLFLSAYMHMDFPQLHSSFSFHTQSSQTVSLTRQT